MSEGRGEKFTYDLEVLGDAPPYRWVVWRRKTKNGTRSRVAEGEADSVADSRFEAYEAAQEAEEERRHRATVRKFELFTVDELPEAADEPPTVPRGVSMAPDDEFL